MTCKDTLEIVAYYIQAILTGGVLWVTIHFYRQLVANDNRREARAVEESKRREIESIKIWCKNEFRACGVSPAPGYLQTAGDRLRRRYPNAVETILEAYAELANEAPEQKLTRPEKFLELMQGFDPGKWPDRMPE